jgi:cytochrome c biogenesis protein CcmG/thiol:disulfide interchange protein DsbE
MRSAIMTMKRWDNKATWLGLIALLLILGATWIVLSKVPAEMAAARADRSPLPRRGFAAPDFTLDTLDGQTIALSDLQGQMVLINFWASWCLPCREEMPAIQQVYERYRDQGFVVLAVNLQQEDAHVAAFVDQLELTFPVLMDRDGDVFDRYRIVALPSTFFVDRAGLIQDLAVGGPLAQAFIESQVVPLLAQEGQERNE